MCCLQKTHIKYKFAEKLKEKECKKIYYVNTNYRHGCVKVTQLCPTLCNPMDCSSPKPPVHGILQARILE